MQKGLQVKCCRVGIMLGRVSKNYDKLVYRAELKTLRGRCTLVAP